MLYRRVFVDRRRLVVVGIRRFDIHGRLELDVRLGRYRDLDGVPAPHRLLVRRPRLGFTVDMRLTDMKIKPIPLGIFRTRLPHGWRRINLDYQPVTDIEALRPQ